MSNYGLIFLTHPNHPALGPHAEDPDELFRSAPCYGNPQSWDDIFEPETPPGAGRLPAADYYASRVKKMEFWCGRCPVQESCADLARSLKLTGPYGGALYMKGAKVPWRHPLPEGALLEKRWWRGWF